MFILIKYDINITKKYVSAYFLIRREALVIVKARL